MSDLEIAVGAARAAGEQLRDTFADVSRLTVTTKTTATDLVSEADEAAERLIRSRLPDGDAVLGEEGGATGAGDRRWVVDPLDGTINYLFGLPQWCVSIALERVCGVIYDPMREELWTAEAGGSAALNGVPIEPSGRSDLATALIATGFGYDTGVRAAQARIVLDVLPRVRDIRRMGSAALDIAWTAAGRYDGYFEHGPQAWDTAAGEVLCSCVGLEVRRLPARDALPPGVLVGAPALADALEPLVSG